MNAELLVTYSGVNATYPSQVDADSSNDSVMSFLREAAQAGELTGIPTNADFTDFVVERFPDTTNRGLSTIMVRPKVTFG